jgi:two-component sensor histidine kinase
MVSFPSPSEAAPVFPPDFSPGATISPDRHRPRADDLHTEANHRIANNLAMIAGLVRLHASDVKAARQESFTRTDVRQLLDEIGSRIETVGRLHRLLSNTRSDGVVNMADHLRETCEALVASMSDERAIALSFCAIGNCAVDPDNAGPVALIVSELVTNSIKHAHPAGAPGKILVRCGPGLAGGIYVEVEDDGVGLPEGFDPWKDGGLGFRVVRNLAYQMGARLAFDMDGLGLKARLIVPAAVLESA